ncbi:NIMA-related kinase 2 [Klebsormidium nitens]|uniref:non-specific serine/threonine protein kinase n=1 Tax=Klebsormidium nitens TaxID=105231 RepID=A0A1Y1IEJ7_KLENI|nr:NIMA-related kinase 2 [Klebsormidium nitens]|eukprot:GAQ88392.1 NIMA-related kinase 2 [Klebsormidium nitens]
MEEQVQQGEMDNELDGYQILRRMGEGAQGRIFLVREKPEDGPGAGSRKKEWVMKMVSLPSKFPQPQQYEDAIREGSTMQYLHHPCVVSCKESFVHEQQTLCIVMEHCKGGDLCTRIKQQAELGQSFPEDLVTDWLVHTLLALEYLHKQRILHRDIKSENIFLHQPLSGGPQIITAQLGDFGIARVLDSSDALASTFVGTPYYMSPELFKGRPYNYKTDIWALGCVLYELLCLRQPFKAKNFPDLAAEVTRGLYPPIQSSYSAEIRNVVACMLTLDPQHRPLASELLELPFLRARAKAFITAHATAAPPQHRRGAGRAFNPVVLYHSLRDQARRLHLVCSPELRESGTETETSTSSDCSPARGRYPAEMTPPQAPDLYTRGGPAPFPATPRFAEWPPQSGDVGGSSPSPPPEPRPPSGRPSVLSDPPPTRASPLYRPIPIRAVPFCPPNMRYDRKEPYEEGPGPPNRKGPPGWSLLHRPPMYKAESAPTCYHVTSGEDLSRSGSSLEDQYGPGEPGWNVDSKGSSNWENTGMDYYGEGLGNPRGVREMREARVKRREVTAAHRARRSPRSPQQASLIEALDRDMILGDDEAEDKEVVHVFHVDASSSSPELNEEGYEVIGCSSAVFPSATRTHHRGSVSDGHQVFGIWPVSDADFGSSGGRTSSARPMPFAAYVSEGKAPSAFSVYRRPPQAASSWKAYEPAGRALENVGKAGMRPAPLPLRPDTVSPHKPLRQPVSDSALLLTPECVTVQYKSPSPPIGPPPKSLRPAVTVRSRRAVNPANAPSREPTPPHDLNGQPSRVRMSRPYAAADATPPGSRSEGSGDPPASDGRSTSPEEGEAEGRNGSSQGRDSNGSSGGGSSTEARSASSSETVHGGSGSSSSMSSKHFDIAVSQAVREETARRIERGAATVRRERATRDGSFGGATSAGEYAQVRPRGRSLKEASGEFLLQNRRHHSEGECALAQGLPAAQPSERRGSSVLERPPRASKGGLAEGAVSQGEETERIRYGAGLGSDTTTSHHPIVRAVSSVSEGARDLPARTGHFVRRAHHSTAAGSAPLARAPVNKAPVSASAPPSARHSLGGPVSGDVNSVPRAFQRGAAYYSDGGDDWNEPSTSGQMAVDDRRRKAGLRPREHPLFADRTEGRARFEYDLAHMHEGGQNARRCTIGTPGGVLKDGVSSQAIVKESSAYQAPLLHNEARGARRSWKEEARSAGVEWWRLPPITNPPQQSLEGGRPRGINPQRTAMVLS